MSLFLDCPLAELEHIHKAQPRVNGKRLGAFIGKEVRLPCRVTQKQDVSTADKEHFILTAVATDDLKVVIQDVSKKDADTTGLDAYLEVCGTVVDDHTVCAQTLIPMPGEIEMPIIDAVIELIHQPRFRRMFFPADAV